MTPIAVPGNSMSHRLVTAIIAMVLSLGLLTAGCSDHVSSAQLKREDDLVDLMKTVPLLSMDVPGTNRLPRFVQHQMDQTRWNGENSAKVSQTWAFHTAGPTNLATAHLILAGAHRGGDAPSLVGCGAGVGFSADWSMLYHGVWLGVDFSFEDETTTEKPRLIISVSGFVPEDRTRATVTADPNYPPNRPGYVNCTASEKSVLKSALS